MIVINKLTLFWQQLSQLGKYIGLFVLCFALVVGCNSNSPETSSTSNSTDSNRISVGTTLKPRTLDPADSYELAGSNIIYNVGESLYTYKLGTTEIEPLLATDMPQISEDGLTYTIPLREGVTFHDGTPFDAEAMAFSLRRFMENGGKPSFLLSDVVEKVEVTGDYELTITLKQPFSAFPALLAFHGTAALSPQAYKIGAGEFSPNTLVGTGRYKLAQFNSDSISLDINENYWGEPAANEGVDLQIYAGNSANLFNSFRTEAIDVAYQSLDANQINNLVAGEGQNNWQVIDGSGTVVNFLALNLQQKPLDRVEVRQAIAAIVDRDLINQRVFEGQAEPIYSLIPTAFDVYEPKFQAAYGDVDVDKAKALLAQAGYSAENPAIVDIWYPSGSITRGIVAETLQAFVERELEGALQFVPNSVESASFFGNVGQGVYPAILADWYPDFLDADNYIQPFLSCSQGTVAEGCSEGAAQSRGSFYYSDRLNQLINQQREATNPEARQDIFTEIQTILAEDVPYVPLWQIKDYAFAQNNIEGVIINPSQNFPFWTITKKKA